MKTTKEKIAVMQAYEDGNIIEIKSGLGNIYKKIKDEDGELEWDWNKNNYSIAEEPKRIPFDGSDAFNLLGQKFKHESDKNSYCLCVHANEDVVTLSDFEIQYEALSKYWLKWNDTLQLWQPCNKVA